MKLFEEFKKTFTLSTTKAALAAYKEIQRLNKGFPGEDNRDFKALGREIDKAAVEAMREVFETQSRFYIEIRGSEGRKDTRRDGIESPDLYGSYGSKSGTLVEIVNDAVEGTAFASRNIPGSYSVLTAVLDQKNGLSTTGDFDYMRKLFGPPSLKGKISLDFSPAENIKIALRELKIHNPKDLAIIILDRPRNQFEIDSAKKSGVTTILIPGGDLVPGLLAVLDHQELKNISGKKLPKNIKAVLLMGSGGWEEGVIAAAGAKATGGHAEARIYSENTDETEQAKILEVDDLVPAKPESIIVCATPVTDDWWFGVSGVEDSKAKTILITQDGFEIIQSV